MTPRHPHTMAPSQAAPSHLSLLLRIVPAPRLLVVFLHVRFEQIKHPRQQRASNIVGRKVLEKKIAMLLVNGAFRSGRETAEEWEQKREEVLHIARL